MVTNNDENRPTKPIRLGLDVIAEIEKQAVYGETSPNQVLRRILDMHKKKPKAEATKRQKSIARKM